MVGVPRSTGCATCVKRRVKCDEAKPGCLRCQKGGRPCPGYTKRFVFKQSSLTKPTRQPDQGTDSEDTLELTDEASSPEDAQVLVLRDQHRIGWSSDSSASTQIYDLIPGLFSPLAQQSQMMGNLIMAFSPTQLKIPVGTHHTRPWLAQVHDRIGTSVPLDLSMRSLSCLYSGLGHADTKVIMAGRSLYGKALRSLRDDMVSGKSSQSEIQSSAMLLAFYELMSNRTDESWIKHSGGASKIMQIRGPDAYKSGFDYAMYLVCRSYIMIEAFITDSACFLEEPEWDALTRISDSPFFLTQEKMFSFHAKGPRLLRDAQRANAGQHDAADVIRRALELRAVSKKNFEDWWDSLRGFSAMPIGKPSGDILLPTMYWFPNMLISGLFCSHHATSSLVNQLLIDSGHIETNALVEENARAAVEICKCVDQAQTQMLLSMYMPFWLRVAADACAPEHYAWIMAKWDYLRTHNVWAQQFRNVQSEPAHS